MSRFAAAALIALALDAAVLHAQAATAAPTAAGGDPRAFCVDTLGGEVWARTELYFGLSRAAGPPIGEEEFAAFLADVVTPRFPDGLTVLSGRGQYRGESGVVVQEPTKVLVLFYPWTANRNRAVERIRTRYKRLFQQEAVLRVDDASCVSF